jgi:hypothetical protein
MKQRVWAALLYLFAALALAGYFDGLYGAGPVVHGLTLVHAGIAGMILLAVASLVSILSLRLGAVCGLIAGFLAWPFFGPLLLSFPWSRMFEILPYAMWADSLAALTMLTITSIYSLKQVSLRVRLGFGESGKHIRPTA